ncbi:MarR family transcriptional regulator [Photobacterium phosphoreum]|jgi:DNA-binding XRE family transcriptional regulator|uniref:MarR family transcriptional regulator n=1 Tax=Photobacterium phosphoreum TaxID=659 RepID=A0AAW4ZPR6_PHOPO|nr:MarR family transcriptional regulator [Photobacterium phosphoreum]MCD9483054.1 MarR family transcriptional regulator [Photobacterium phosphoreum]MCD9489852.1 MarR family transcriptional regulator [Photobacterium phosphoreum]MCD9511489.1 MarR family transcriptional regulator [Photobacterium phosphoreum]MCF2189118.1 MarR family transcriptional regulator [Photobacterium phosphoreum]MCF2301167.1 MarR family transcriptional regulator [Photobacterium phosphoreum]
MEEKKQDNLVAVLSGDIVRSTELEHSMYEDLLYTLHNQLSFICNSNLNNKFDITRGDSFQILLQDPENAAKYALLIRTALKSRNSKFDCRISIALGKDVSIRHSINSSTGDAFTLSGRALDDMTSDTLKITTLNQSFNDDFNLLTKYLDHQVSEMTERQFNITHIMLKKQGSVTQGEIAELLGASRESINRTINSSKLNFVIEYSQLFSKKVKEIIL